MNKLSNSQFVFCTTADGSPSLALFDGEMMHNRDGAFSETCYVYEPVIDAVLNVPGDVTLLSVGLGLGYVEMLAVSKTLVTGRHADLTVHSFESDVRLRKTFTEWLCGVFVTLPYEQIAARFEQQFQLPTGSIRRALSQQLAEKKLHLQGTLNSETRHTSYYHGICFDAFSPKTTPELWSEKVLRPILNQTDTHSACFATYASTSQLKQILKSSGFEIQSRKGFAKKRECILANKKTTE